LCTSDVPVPLPLTGTVEHNHANQSQPHSRLLGSKDGTVSSGTQPRYHHTILDGSLRCARPSHRPSQLNILGPDSRTYDVGFLPSQTTSRFSENRNTCGPSPGTCSRAKMPGRVLVSSQSNMRGSSLRSLLHRDGLAMHRAHQSCVAPISKQKLFLYAKGPMPYQKQLSCEGSSGVLDPNTSRVVLVKFR
jgi:hypothetical protein